ncbi:hypothetical protein [Brevibacillus formosus]|uniref:hypothetical protein n=1 Tax=Brevibacillus formosus TaxID=54913 RepID=UPI003F194172
MKRVATKPGNWPANSELTHQTAEHVSQSIQGIAAGAEQQVNDAEKAIHAMSQGDVAVKEEVISGQINDANNETVSVVEFIEGIAHVSRIAAENTQSVVASVQEQTASMEQITTASRTLAEMAEELQHSIRKFQL